MAQGTAIGKTSSLFLSKKGRRETWLRISSLEGYSAHFSLGPSGWAAPSGELGWQVPAGTAPSALGGLMPLSPTPRQGMPTFFFSSSDGTGEDGPQPPLLLLPAYFSRSAGRCRHHSSKSDLFLDPSTGPTVPSCLVFVHAVPLA